MDSGPAAIRHLPAVGVDHRLGDGVTADTVDRVTDVLFGGDDDAEGKQNDDRDRVVKLEDIVVDLDAACLEQRLQATKNVEHYLGGGVVTTV